MLYFKHLCSCTFLFFCTQLLSAQYATDIEFLAAYKGDKQTVKNEITSLLKKNAKDFNALYFDALYQFEEFKSIQTELIADDTMEEESKQHELQYLQREVLNLYSKTETLSAMYAERLDVKRLHWNIYYNLTSDLRDIEFNFYKFIEDSNGLNNSWVIDAKGTKISTINEVAEFFKSEISLLDLDLSLQDKNLAFLEKLQAYLPEYYFIPQLLANYYLGQDNPKKAYVYLLQAYTLNENDKYILNSLVSICKTLGQSAEAEMYKTQVDKL